MLDALGTSSPNPRLRGAAIPPPVGRNGAGTRAEATEKGSHLRHHSSPYHCAQTLDAHPTVDVPTDVQKHEFGREHMGRQTKIVDRWMQGARPAGGCCWAPSRAPFAPGPEEDRRALPSQAAGSTKQHLTAGKPSPRDLLGAPRLGGITDFGLAPTPEPRNRPVGRERLQVTGAATLAAREACAQLQPGSAAAFFSPRPGELYESPRMMRHRGLKSAPVSLGFAYPNKANLRPRGFQEGLSEETLAEASAITEYYPLNHSVLHAQYTVDDCSHIL